MKTVKIFIASSIVEFEAERDKLAARLRGLNDKLIKNGIYLELSLCEDWTHTWSERRKQEDFNEQIRDCHYFFAIVGQKVGNATQEEIEVAFRQFRESGNLKQPRIIVFFQDLPEEEKDAEVFRLQERVRQLGQYREIFSNVDKIYGQILTELFTDDAVMNPESLEMSRKNHWAVLFRIQKNRGKIKKLSKETITEDTEAELLALYRENMVLTEWERSEWGTLYEYADFLHRRGYHDKAVQVGKRLDDHYTEEDKADARAALKKLLGDCHNAQGHYEEAETHYRAALELYRTLTEKKYGAEMAEIRAKLAEIMIQTFRYEAAERFYREALQYYLGDAEKYAREIGLSCYSLQRLMGQARNQESSILKQAEQIAVRCAVKGIRGKMGTVRDSLLHWLEAFPCPDTAAELLSKNEAKARKQTQDKPDKYEQTLAGICGDTAYLLYEHHQMEPAEALARKALEIHHKLENQGELSDSCNLLALILTPTKRPKEAEQCYQEALKISRHLLKESPFSITLEEHVSAICENLAVLLESIKRYQESECYYREALEIRRSLTIKASFFVGSLAMSCNNLALFLWTIARYEEAERYYREALEIQQPLVEKYPFTKSEGNLALYYINLANLLDDTTRHEEAERYYLKALEVLHKLVKKDPMAFEPNLAYACHNYGLLLLKHKCDPNSALAYFDEAIEIRKKYPYLKELLNNSIGIRRQCQQEIWVRHGQ